ncbi:MAG: ABC transporter substrate-binding protein [Propioniciclava sp.]
MKLISATLAGVASTALLVSGCSSTAPTATSTPAGTTAGGGFPATVTNCGHDVVVESAPQRIFMVNSDDVSFLAPLGALDRVIARTAEPLPGVYPADVEEQVKAIPLTETETNATGGSVISTEAIIATEPDLVLAPENAVDRVALEAAGIPSFSPPAYCEEPDAVGTASFDLVYTQIETYGTLLGTQAEAAALIEDLKAQIAEPASDQGTGAALYVPAGGGTLYPYGAPSMITPIFAAAGLENLYIDSDKRVFEVNLEDLLERDPATVVLLYSEGTPEAAVENFLGVNGVEGLSAVKNDRVVTLQFPFTDPPNPLSVSGVGKLTEALDGLS